MILGKRELYDFCQKAFQESGNFGLKIDGIKIVSKSEKIDNHLRPNFLVYKQNIGQLDEQYDIIAKISFYNKAFYYGYYITFLKSNIDFNDNEVLFYLHKCINGRFLIRQSLYIRNVYNIGGKNGDCRGKIKIIFM